MLLISSMLGSVLVVAIAPLPKRVCYIVCFLFAFLGANMYQPIRQGTIFRKNEGERKKKEEGGRKKKEDKGGKENEKGRRNPEESGRRNMHCGRILHMAPLHM